MPKKKEDTYNRFEEPGMLGGLPNGDLLSVDLNDPLPVMKGDEKDFLVPFVPLNPKLEK